MRKLKSRVATLEAESSANAAHTSRLTGGSNQINTFVVGGGGGHTNNTPHLGAGGGAGGSQTRIGIAGGSSSGNGIDISTGRVGGAGGGGAASGAVGAGGAGAASGAGVAGGAAGGAGGAGGAGRVIIAGGTNGGSGTSFSGGMGSAGTSVSGGSSASGSSFSGSTGLGYGGSGGYIDFASLQGTVQNMFRAEMQSQEFRGTEHLHRQYKNQITNTTFMFTELFSLSAYLASSVQTGLPGPKGKINISFDLYYKKKICTYTY